jgi:hypothetical protein
MEVKNPSGYPSIKGVACTVTFDPVTTTAVKLELVQPSDKSCGLYEWSVK